MRGDAPCTVCAVMFVVFAVMASCRRRGALLVCAAVLCMRSAVQSAFTVTACLLFLCNFVFGLCVHPPQIVFLFLLEGVTRCGLIADCS